MTGGVVRGSSFCKKKETRLFSAGFSNSLRRERDGAFYTAMSRNPLLILI